MDGIQSENDEDVDLDKQRDLPVKELVDLITRKKPLPDMPPVPTVPTVPTGRYIAYLDVWQRHITTLEDEGIREVALDGPDTATRTKTVWQVKLLGPNDKDFTCASEPSEWKDLVDRTATAS